MLTQTFSGPARFLTYNLLKIPKSTTLARYARVTTTFLICGVFHMLVDVAGGIPLRQSGAVQFFCMQLLGIMAEDLIHAFFYQSTSKRETTRKNPTWGERLIGYIWLVGFLVWTVPVWSFPALRRNTGDLKDEFLPFVIFSKTSH